MFDVGGNGDAAALRRGSPIKAVDGKRWSKDENPASPITVDPIIEEQGVILSSAVAHRSLRIILSAAERGSRSICNPNDGS
jgi:hypothetical protein